MALFGPLTPITRRRLEIFKRNRLGLWALRILGVVFLVTLFAEFLANDRPILVWYDGKLHAPVFFTYPETAFGGEFETEAVYNDPEVVRLIRDKGWMLRPPIPYDYRSIASAEDAPFPAPPSWNHLLGTDDQGRDVMARLIYGFRISVLFGLVLTAISAVIGISAGAIQGYFGGWVDLSFQRFMEVWRGMPRLYMLIILSAIVEPNFWWLLGLLLLFEWMAFVDVVRAEFLRARNFDYVRAAKAMGARDLIIMFRHVLPNALVGTLTFFPFVLSGSVTALTSLDFLGFGLPPGSPSLGELLNQGKNNLQAPWLGMSGFVVIAGMLALTIFVGAAVRDALDPRKVFR
jgi:microcin C transport system permease protein